MNAEARRHLIAISITFAAIASICISVWMFVILPVLGRVQGHNDMKWIGLALHQYHDNYGSFPPVAVLDQNSTPIHSWRTLIEPELDRDDSTLGSMFPAYRFDLPWDSDENATASEDHRFNGNRLSFFALTGPDNAWSRTGVRTIKDFRDGTSNTAWVIGLPSNDVNWRKPLDIDVEKDGSMSLDGQPVNTRGEAYVLFADGHVRYFEEGLPANFAAALTINAEDAFVQW